MRHYITPICDIKPQTFHSYTFFPICMQLLALEMLSHLFYYIWPLVSSLCIKITDLMQASQFRNRRVKKRYQLFFAGPQIRSQFQSLPLEVKGAVLAVPAVNRDGSSVRGVAGFDPSEEVEERGGILRHTVVWPGCKLELTHLPPLAAAALM